MQFLVYSVCLWWLTHHYKVFKYFLIMIMIIIIIVIISLISFFSKVLDVTYSETFVWGPYTTRNINTLINEYTVWPTKKVSKNEVIKKIIFGLNSLYCPVIINKILTVIKGKKPISWLSIALLTISIKKCDNHTV